MTIKEIVLAYLKNNGYNGLCADECGCGVDDLAPCGEMPDTCVPACKRGDIFEPASASGKQQTLTDIACEWPEDADLSTAESNAVWRFVRYARKRRGASGKQQSDSARAAIALLTDMSNAVDSGFEYNWVSSFHDIVKKWQSVHNGKG